MWGQMMAKQENTLKVAILKALSASDHKTTLSDGGGLSGEVRIRADGTPAVSFVYRYRAGDKKREKRLGTWPEKDLAVIRAERNHLRQMVANGLDPIEEERKAAELARQAWQAAEAKRQAEAAEAARLAARMTYGDLFARYRAAHVSKLKGAVEIIRRHQKDVLPAIGAIYADEVTRQMVAAVGQRIADRGARRAAHLTLGDICACYKWAIDTALLDDGQNPAASIKKTRIGDTSKMRDRVLSEAELKHLLQSALPACSLTPMAKAGVRLMLATACRVGELLRARWADIDLAAGTWTVPAEHAKNGQAHVIHLSRYAMTAIEELASHAMSAIWLYPDKTGQTHVCIKTLTKQLRDRQKGEAGAMSRRASDTSSLILDGGDWTSHDLRRTAATLMGELGVMPHIIDKCQNHVEANRVTRTYQRQEYMAERKAAFDVLGERLALLANPDAANVLTLKRA